MGMLSICHTQCKADKYSITVAFQHTDSSPALKMGDSYIIAVDFGTAYSGYAFSITARGKPVDPQLNHWGREVGKETPKAPTCILFNEHEEFLKFGYDAQMTYVAMCGDEARKHFFFNCFKMSLYDTVSTNYINYGQFVIGI